MYAFQVYGLLTMCVLLEVRGLSSYVKNRDIACVPYLIIVAFYPGVYDVSSLFTWHS
jgi:hypothetical protein